MSQAPALDSLVTPFLERRPFKTGLLKRVFREFDMERFLEWANSPGLQDGGNRSSVATGQDLVRIFDPLVAEVFAGEGLDPVLVKHELFREYRDQVAVRLRALLLESEIDSKTKRDALDLAVKKIITGPASKRGRAKGAQKFADRGKKIRALRDLMMDAKSRFCRELGKSFVFPEQRLNLSPAELETRSTLLDEVVVGGFINIWLDNLEATDEEVAGLMQKYFPQSEPWSAEDVVLDPELKDSLRELLEEEERGMAQKLLEEEIGDDIVLGFDLTNMDDFFDRLEDQPLSYESIYRELGDVGVRRQAIRARALLECLSNLFMGGLEDGIRDGAAFLVAQQVDKEDEEGLDEEGEDLEGLSAEELEEVEEVPVEEGEAPDEELDEDVEEELNVAPLSKLDITRLIYLNMQEANSPADIVQAMNRTNEVDGWEWDEESVVMPWHLLETVKINADDGVSWGRYQSARDLATVLWWLEEKLDEAEVAVSEGVINAALFARLKAVDVAAMREELRQKLPKRLRDYV